MTDKYVKKMFLMLENDGVRDAYIQKSFQAWHDDGMTVDDTHKITKKYLLIPLGEQE